MSDSEHEQLLLAYKKTPQRSFLASGSKDLNNSGPAPDSHCNF